MNPAIGKGVRVTIGMCFVGRDFVPLGLVAAEGLGCNAFGYCHCLPASWIGGALVPGLRAGKLNEIFWEVE